MDDRFIRAGRYRSKAAEIRLLAESMKMPANKAILLDVAQDYLNLANTLDYLTVVGE